MERKLAIMQPYFFPYLGYFQLIHAADRFVFYDDVNYIKSGWINRNRYLDHGEARYFTIPTQGASSFVPIREVGIDARNTAWQRKLVETLRIAYKRAPHAEQGLALLREALAQSTERIADVARRSVELTLEYIGVKRDLVSTSTVYGNADLHGAERVRDICRRESATVYLNAPGGQALYRSDDFAAQGCRLFFLQPRFPEYSQGGGPFVPGLSILDIVMHCPREEIANMVANYGLEPAQPDRAASRPAA